jgi:putative phosphonate metabolism protein
MEHAIHTHPARITPADFARRPALSPTKTGFPRCAIYFAPPPQSAWWRFGCAWLERDPVTGAAVEPLPCDLSGSSSIVRVTAEPRRYGFHATLKAPFRLAPDHGLHHVYAQAASLAITLKPVALPALRLCEIGDFVALGNADGDGAEAGCHRIAAQCVAYFDNLRARPDAAELSRRRAAGLTPRQNELLAKWGYPHVFDEYRFHVTLTGKLPRALRRCVMDALATHVHALRGEPLLLDALTVFVKPAPDAPFVVTRRFGFDGHVEVYRDAS